MKQSKRKKPATARVVKTTASPAVSASPALPDDAYVEQLLAGSAPAPALVPAVPAEESAAVAAAPAALLPTVIALPAQCLLRDAVECRQQLLAHLDSPLCIDAAAVERIDTAFLQVLLSFLRSRAASAGQVTWLNVNAVVAEAVSLLGLHAALKLPELSAAA